MYAVIQTGGKQYRVQPGEVIEIEKVAGDVGAKTKFSEVLLCASGGDNAKIWLGKPTLAGATVDGEVISQGRGDKILIVKMKRRKQYRKTQGHRQELTHVLVTGVSNGSGESLTLSADDRKATLAKFQSHLTPKYGKNPQVRAGVTETGSKARSLTSARAARSAASTGVAPTSNVSTTQSSTDATKSTAPKAAKKTAAKDDGGTTGKKPAAKKRTPKAE